MSTDGILEYQGTKRVLFRGDTSNIVFDTRTTSLGIGVTGSNNPSSNLYITGNAYVSSNLAIGGVMTMGVVNVAARHNLQAVTDMGNVTTHTVEFTNPTTSIVASGNVEVGGVIHGYTKISVTSPSGSESTTNAPGYKTHTFTSDGTFTVTAPGIVEYLIVAGGGSGGAGRYDNKTPGAGGGGGGVLNGKCFVAAGSHAVVVGDGGASVSWGNSKSGINGQNSSFNGKVSIGGGGGRVNITWDTSSNGGSGGGCGGGGSYIDGGLFNKSNDPGRGIIPQGNDGGRGHPESTNATTNNAAGGGGGAGSKGYNAHSVVGGNGGDGVTSTISGSSVTYAGGGGGSGPSFGYGGTGGGGNGINTNGNASSGTGGLGGGGGGQRGNGGGNSGAGGSGIVIIRYLI